MKNIFHRFLFLLLILIADSSYSLNISESKEIFNKQQILSKKNFTKQTNYLAIDGQDIYLINKLGIIYKYNLANHKREIVFNCNGVKPESNSYKSYSIYYSQDHLLIALDGKLMAFNLLTKQIAWEYQADYSLGSPMIIENDTIFLITRNGQIQARNIHNGEVKWFFQNNLGGLKKKNYPRIFLRNNQLVAFYNDGQIIIFNKNNGANNMGAHKPLEFSRALEIILYDAIGKNLHGDYLLINSNQRRFLLNVDEYNMLDITKRANFKNAFYSDNIIYALTMRGKLFAIDPHSLENYPVYDIGCKFHYKESESTKNRKFDNSNIFQYGDSLLINCKKNILTEFNMTTHCLTKSKIKSSSIITVDNNYIISWFKKGIHINKI